MLYVFFIFCFFVFRMFLFLPFFVAHWARVGKVGPGLALMAIPLCPGAAAAGRICYIHEAEERTKKEIFEFRVEFRFLKISILSSCFVTTAPVAGLRFWVTTSKFLISEPSVRFSFFAF